jgi:hypothetical protein
MSELFYKAAGAVLAPFRYAEREVEHIKKVAKEDLQAFVASLIKWAMIGLVAWLFLLFISITAAAAINEATGSTFIGFAVVSGFYLLTGSGLYIWKEASEKKKKQAAHSGKMAHA